MLNEEIVKELKKLKKPYLDLNKIELIPLKEGMAKKIIKSYILKTSNHFRVILMQGSNKFFVEFYNTEDLDKKWINKTPLSLPTIIKEAAHFLKNGAPQQKKYFISKETDSTFRNVEEKDIKEYLKKIFI